MNSPQRPTALETLHALEAIEDEAAAEREMDRILALSPHELERELEDLGIDPAAARAQGDAIAQRIGRAAEPETTSADPGRSGLTKGTPAPRRQKGRAVLLLLAAAFAAILAATQSSVGTSIARWWHPVAPDIRPDTPSPQEVALARAHRLRAAAHQDCSRSQWASCLQGLDEAHALDPAGDAEPAVQADRRAAVTALTGPPRGDKPQP
jgi:hypothetical protein